MQNDNAKFKKRLYSWALRLIKFINKLPKNFVCGIIKKQLLRNNASILANYIEVNPASSKKDFINFFTHFLKSANESKIWLALPRDTNKRDQQELKWLMNELLEIVNINNIKYFYIKRKEKIFYF